MISIQYTVWEKQLGKFLFFTLQITIYGEQHTKPYKLLPIKKNSVLLQKEIAEYGASSTQTASI